MPPKKRIKGKEEWKAVQESESSSSSDGSLSSEDDTELSAKVGEKKPTSAAQKKTKEVLIHRNPIPICLLYFKNEKLFVSLGIVAGT